MDEIKKILNKFKVTHRKMKEINKLQKQAKHCSNAADEIKNIYDIETDINIKRRLLLAQYQLLESAQFKNDKVKELLDEFDSYVHSKI